MPQRTVLRALEPRVGVCLQGQQLLRQVRERTSDIPGHVLRIWRPHLLLISVAPRCETTGTGAGPILAPRDALWPRERLRGGASSVGIAASTLGDSRASLRATSSRRRSVLTFALRLFPPPALIRQLLSQRGLRLLGQLQAHAILRCPRRLRYQPVGKSQYVVGALRSSFARSCKA